MQLDRLRKVSDRVSVCMRPQNSPKRWVTGGLSACSMQPMIDMSNDQRRLAGGSILASLAGQGTGCSARQRGV